MKQLKVPLVLRTLLQLQRPYDSVQEAAARAFIEAHIETLKVGATVDRDFHGNTVVEVGSGSGCVFTAHYDTVHRQGGTQKLLQVDNFIMADDMQDKACVLGADDAAGVYLLTEMIAAGKPGKYMFFVGEERGGIGSSAFIQDNPNFSATSAVAFDRRGTRDVLTHQGGYRTCSDEYAKALSIALNSHGKSLQYRPDDGGIYTDTKEFAHLVPECTNISVGYYDEHTAKERLDLGHLMLLRDAVLAIDWESLPIKRVPVEDEYSYMSGSWQWDAFRDTPPLISMHERIEKTILKHYSTLPDDVFGLLSDLEEIFHD